VGHGELLASNGELVHLEAADLLVLRDVLGGLTHGDVDIGKSGLRRPRLVGAFGALRRSFHGVGEEFIGGLAAVRGAAREARHGLDASGDEDVTLAGANRVRGHANGLQ